MSSPEERSARRDRLNALRSRGSTSSRLDTPADTQRPLVRRPSVDRDAFGVFAEQFARFMGTATFLLYMTAFVVVWIVWNLLAPDAARFDGYPFIFLTLMLSLQASYAAPLILLAQNRQEQRDRIVAEQDRHENTQSHADMEFLAREMASLRMLLGEVATRDYVRSELRSLLSDIEERWADEPDEEPDDDPSSLDRPVEAGAGETDPTSGAYDPRA
ncbi:membrane protein [Marmoricola endophyticus]|uniref:Membrane protein n=1 Tax=Marmoricola endophyticus TaxID=2040280 RepID=A0A917BQN8_9ACTN|nr:membrane protein [Marmoricola endophyticus]